MADLTDLITQAIRDADADTLDYERRTPDGGYGTHADAVMSVVAPAIQAAKAEALREAALQYGPGQLTGMFSRDGYTRAWLQARATEYETGDQR